MMKELLDADQRLVMLRSLIDAGGEANESILQDCLDVFGHRVSRDQVRTHITWLAEQGLVAIENVGSYMVANLTGRGQDVAEGRSTVPGVKKPRPRG
ncbi:ArsR family transcriptional regulator [uncultured Tolumonas sp.]|uniref:VpaChn25_0724 family phage protein n=1 Tax=uncultured Tolumonas sp. TaxID=263765 RepID=UPI003749676A